MTFSTTLPATDRPVERLHAAHQMERLEMQVQQRLGSRVRDFHIVERPDGVVLQGRTTTYHAKQVAQHAVMELTGQPIVANDIEVC